MRKISWQWAYVRESYRFGQFPDLRGNGWLGEMQLPRGPREAAQPRARFEDRELRQHPVPYVTMNS